jgi:hypothetical protein
MARIGSNGYYFRGYDVSGKRDAQRIANRDAEQDGNFSVSMLEDIATGKTVDHIGPSEAAKNKYRRAKYGKNPARRMTKTQRKAKTAKTSKTRRIAKALQNYLRQVNPGKKLAGARVRKNKGGSITIVPVKLPNNPRR